MKNIILSFFETLGWCVSIVSILMWIDEHVKLIHIAIGGLIFIFSLLWYSLYQSKYKNK